LLANPRNGWYNAFMSDSFVSKRYVIPTAPQEVTLDFGSNERTLRLDWLPAEVRERVTPGRGPRLEYRRMTLHFCGSIGAILLVLSLMARWTTTPPPAPARKTASLRMPILPAKVPAWPPSARVARVEPALLQTAAPPATALPAVPVVRQRSFLVPPSVPIGE
jgi:hypothetical protein